MTALRPIPYPVHGAIELLPGLLLVVAPFALGFGVAAGVVSVAVGSLIVGLALSAAATEPRGRSLPVGTHHALDHGLALGLAVAAAAVAVSGDAIAGTVLIVVAAAHLALSALTRYSLKG